MKKMLKTLKDKLISTNNICITYMRKWFSIVIIKTLVDLALGFFIVFIFFSLGYVFSILLNIYEMKSLAASIKKSFLILWLGYLAAILATTILRTVYLFKSEFSGTKVNTNKETKG